MRSLLLVAVTACWTGAVPTPAPPVSAPPVAVNPRLEISLARTMCFGNCPVYKLVIRGDGRYEWTGEKFVEVMGTRRGVLAEGGLAAIDAAITRAQFFQRDGYGELQQGPDCKRNGTTTTCSWKGAVICSDTSHTILTIRRGAHTHTIDNAHCTDEDDAMSTLEHEIVDRTQIADWIGKG